MSEKTIKTDTIKEIFELMQKYGIECFEGNGIEVKRESLKIIQSDNSLKIAMQQTKQRLGG